MPSRFWAEAAGNTPAVLLMVVMAAAGSVLLFGHTLDYGFDYDDYHFVRPHSPEEVARAFHDTWDATGIEVPFYRPLTVLFYAARFEWFGWNARAHHALSLAMFACAALLAGLLGWRMVGQPLAGVLAEALFLSHPAMPYAQVAWITNQMHLLQSLLVLASCSWWFAIRARSAMWWLPLLPAGAAAFLVKEDGIMLLPAILALHWLRRRVAEPGLPAVPRSFLALAALTVLTLLTARSYALDGRLGGYGRPSLDRAWLNYANGLNSVLRLLPAHREWQLVSSVFVSLLPLSAVFVWRRSTAGARYCLLAGAALAVLFNVPFALVSKVQQYHLVALGGVLMLAGASSMLWSALPGRLARATLAVIVAAGCAAMAAVARDISRDFAPFGPVVRYHDSIVEGWAAVPEELRAYLAQKRTPGAEVHLSPNPVDELRTVSWGLHPAERSAGGVEYRWMSGAHAEIHVAPDVREVVVPLRHDMGAFREAASVAIQANGRVVDRLHLGDSEWHPVRVRLGALRPPRLRRLHRIVVAIERAWVPAEIYPDSHDRRTLGLQVGALTLR